MRLRSLVLLAAGLAAGATATERSSLSRMPDSHGSSNRFRIAFSKAIMTKISESDARAAVKLWADNLIKERGIQGAAVTSVPDSEEVIRLMNGGEVDGAVLTTPEFFRVNRDQVSHIFIASNNGETEEEYVLLVRHDDGARRLADLRGKRLLWLENFRTSLARPWLDVALAREQLPPADAFFGSVSAKEKPILATLPVFFRSADACLVNRRSFETMAELNPQVGKQLRVLAASPRLVPGLCCLSASYQSPVKSQIIDALLHIKASVAGQQLLTVFQFGDLLAVSDSCLQSARDLLEEHARRRSSKQPATVTSSPGPDPTASAPTH